MIGKTLFYAAVVLIAVLPGISFCAEEPAPAVSVQASKIVNKTGYNANFAPLIDMIKHELFSAGLQVVDEADMGHVLQEADKSSFFGEMEGNASKKLKVPGYFIRASILQYGFSATANRNPISGNVTQTRTAQVQITFNIVDARTARMQCSVNTKSVPVMVKALEGFNVSQKGNFDEQALQTASQECVRQMIRELIKIIPVKFRPAPASGKVLKVGNGRILVKINPDKIKIGTVLDIFRVEKLDDEDDADLVDEIYLLSAQVTDVRRKYCICVPITKSSVPVGKGCIARISVRFKSQGNDAAISSQPATGNSGFVPPF